MTIRSSRIKALGIGLYVVCSLIIFFCGGKCRKRERPPNPFYMLFVWLIWRFYLQFLLISVSIPQRITVFPSMLELFQWFKKRSTASLIDSFIFSILIFDLITFQLISVDYYCRLWRCVRQQSHCCCCCYYCHSFSFFSVEC